MKSERSMSVNLFSTRPPVPPRLPKVRKPAHDRRFEALYMQSFIEMRARSPKD